MEFSEQALNLYLFLLKARPEMVSECVKMMCVKYLEYRFIQRKCINMHDLMQCVVMANFVTDEETTMPWDIPGLIPMDQFFDKLREGLTAFGLTQFDKFNDYIEKTHHLLLLLEDQGLDQPQIELVDPDELRKWRRDAKYFTL